MSLVSSVAAAVAIARSLLQAFLHQSSEILSGSTLTQCVTALGSSMAGPLSMGSRIDDAVWDFREGQQ